MRNIARAAGMQVLGKRQARAQVPWLRGHEDEKAKLDAEIERARAAWALSDDAGAPAALAERRRVAQERRRTLRS